MSLKRKEKFSDYHLTPKDFKWFDWVFLGLISTFVTGALAFMLFATIKILETMCNL